MAAYSIQVRPFNAREDDVDWIQLSVLLAGDGQSTEIKLVAEYPTETRNTVFPHRG